MRVTSDLFVAALVRRIFSSGGFAAVGKRGAHEAGAIFLTLRHRDGVLSLYGPAPQSDYGTGKPSDRRFVPMIEAAEQDEIDKRLAKEGRFDPDYWLVECECTPELFNDIAGIRTP
jgi:hypothetical protein